MQQLFDTRRQREWNTKITRLCLEYSIAVVFDEVVLLNNSFWQNKIVKYENNFDRY